MSENKKSPEEPAPTGEDVCKPLNEEESAEEESTKEEQLKQKRDQEIISTAVDGVLSFFQVW